jgi:hypothetical protein
LALENNTIKPERSGFMVFKNSLDRKSERKFNANRRVDLACAGAAPELVLFISGYFQRADLSSVAGPLFCLSLRSKNLFHIIYTSLLLYATLLLNFVSKRDS